MIDKRGDKDILLQSNYCLILSFMTFKEVLLSELRDHVLVLTDEKFPHSKLKNVRFILRGSQQKFGCLISKPSFALVVSGSKKALVGDHFYSYGPGSCLLTGSGIPDSFEIVDGTHKDPFLAISVDIESDICDWAVSYLADKKTHLNEGTCQIFSIYEADEDLLSTFLRLSELASNPNKAKIFEEIIKKELYLRVLSSPLGSLFMRLFISGSTENKVRRASDWIAAHYKQKIDPVELAVKFGLSPAAFYRHFKKTVGVTPARLIRNLRLTEAKRLMMEEEISATIACFKVGYESTTYFNREFKNLFGESPLRHIKSLRDQSV